jgi:transcriptional regulator with XRE-family HTH domain
MNMDAELLRLGETFRQVREQHRLGVAELAARTDINVEHISALEAGQLDPTYDVLLILADGIGVRVSAFVPKE